MEGLNPKQAFGQVSDRIGVLLDNILLILENHSMMGVECVIDTGFEGFLTLPLNTVQNYGLAYLGPIHQR